MIIECPKCKSTFRVANDIATKSYSNFKCSVCEHIWKINVNIKKSKLNENNETKSNYYYVIMLNLAILLIVAVSLFLFKDNLIYSNSFWTEFYEFFLNLNLIPIK